MNFDEINKIIKDNNRYFRSPDAKSSYADLVTNLNLPELLIFEMVEMFDLLQFSAYEMFLSASDLKYSKISLNDVLDIKQHIGDILGEAYYSDKLVKNLIKIYNIIANKRNLDIQITVLEEHVYYSLHKELFTYRATHPLVIKYQKNIIKA